MNKQTEIPQIIIVLSLHTCKNLHDFNYVLICFTYYFFTFQGSWEQYLIMKSLLRHLIAKLVLGTTQKRNVTSGD